MHVRWLGNGALAVGYRGARPGDGSPGFLTPGGHEAYRGRASPMSFHTR